MESSIWPLRAANKTGPAATLDHPQIAEFVAGLDRINELAETSKGFLRRFKTESRNATDAEHAWSANRCRG